MRKRVAKLLLSVLCVNMLNVCLVNINSNVVRANGEEKTFVALTQNTKIKKVIGNVAEGYDEIVKGGCHIYRFEADDKEVESITQNRNICISEDVEVTGCGNVVSNMKDYSCESEWDMEMINNVGKNSNNVEDPIDIAILDSGIDFSSDINVVDLIDLVDDNNEFNIFSDMTGHGTSIAGIIASSGEHEEIKGINSNVNIYSARILDENNSAPISRVVEAIYWAISKNVKIINVSFGTKENSPVLEKAINDAMDKGILVVAAAGNTGEDVLYPAAYDGVLSVGAVDSKGNITEFSADEKKVDIMAPGEKVKSVGSFGGSIIVSGTSISVPHVVGAASLLWAKDKSVSADFIRNLIIYSANESNLSKSKKGIVDIDYAFKIYDKYKEIYEKDCNNRNRCKKIEKNRGQLSVSHNDYVDGVWQKEGHEVAAAYAGKFMELNTEQIKILKKGAIYPDKAFSRMVDNPQWHTATVDNVYNYISAYRCAALIARALKAGNEINTKTIKMPEDMDMNGYKKMINQVKSITWTKDLLENHKVCNKNKGLFAVGMAIHVITDTFAHQAYMKKDGKWIHLNHYQEVSCDKWDYSDFKNRFQCAKDAACGTLFSYAFKSESPGYFDYIRFTDFKDFKLKRFKEYLKAQENLSKSDLTVFESEINKMNID